MAPCATVPASFARSAPILLSAQLCENSVQLCVHLITCFVCFDHKQRSLRRLHRWCIAPTPTTLSVRRDRPIPEYQMLTLVTPMAG